MRLRESISDHLQTFSSDELISRINKNQSKKSGHLQMFINISELFLLSTLTLDGGVKWC